MTRRQCIGAALGAAAGSSCAPVPQSGPDKITGLEILTVQVNSRPWVTFRVRTGTGLSGLGDATHSAREPALAASVARKLFEDIRGGGPFEIEPLRQAALPLIENASPGEKRAHAAAFAGLEQCLWDLQGKILGLPCYQLFGGKLHDTIRNYANINRSTRGDDRTPKGFAATAPARARRRIRCLQAGRLRSPPPRRDGRRGLRERHAVRYRVHRGCPRNNRPGPRLIGRRAQPLRPPAASRSSASGSFFPTSRPVRSTS